MSEIGVTMHWRGTNRKTKTSIIRIVNLREDLHWWWWLLVCWRNTIGIRPRLLVANHALGVVPGKRGVEVQMRLNLINLVL
jgi:hypothetical protein